MDTKFLTAMIFESFPRSKYELSNGKDIINKYVISILSPNKFKVLLDNFSAKRTIQKWPIG